MFAFVYSFIYLCIYVFIFVSVFCSGVFMGERHHGVWCLDVSSPILFRMLACGIFVCGNTARALASCHVLNHTFGASCVCLIHSKTPHVKLMFQID